VIVGLGALFVCGTLIKHAFTLGGKGETRVAGILLDRPDYPKVYELVDHVAKRLRARSPDNVVVGLDPTFFATSAKVRVFDRQTPLEGETLFISLPLSRVLTLEEIVAILGHELGHFRGKDTAYSLRFAPVYAGLGSALEAVAPGEEREGAFQLMALPAVALLAFMFEVFARNESKISRARELAADRAATEVASPDALGTALLKVATFAPLWVHCQRENIDRLNKGLVTRNLSLAFANLIRYDLDREKIAARMDEVLRTRIAHPTDSHPPIVERLTALRGKAPHYNVDAVFTVADGAASGLGDLDVIEKQLTTLEHRLLVGAGISDFPEEKALTDDEKYRQAAMNAAYVLGATIINADGRWTRTQFVAAEQAERELMPDFSRIDFREYCRYLQEAPDAAVAAKMLAETLNDNGRRLVLEWLRQVTYAEPQPSQHAIEWFAYIEHVLGQDART
jgi:Zn-dependent protease with chaperone function